MAKDHVRMGRPSDGKPCLYCTHCSEQFPVPIGTTDWFVGVARVFVKVHARCKPGDKHPSKLCGLQALPGVCDGIPL
ncbi:MAG: hypothetical protein IT464_12665 [Planctomycetes bacterium]|nr:hypothetical protein [Planctomycetota bacterium]